MHLLLSHGARPTLGMRHGVFETYGFTAVVLCGLGLTTAHHFRLSFSQVLDCDPTRQRLLLFLHFRGCGRACLGALFVLLITALLRL